MNIGLTHAILAIVAGPEARVEPGGAPVFRVQDEQERERVAKHIAAAILGVVHELGEGTYIVVRH